MATAPEVDVEWKRLVQADAEAAALGDMSPTSPRAPLAVGDVVGQRSTVVCVERATLADAVELLITHDRTAAGVVDDDRTLVGVITENDMLQAYALGVQATTQVKAWLQSGHARLPASQLPKLTVQSSTTLLEAAVRMRSYSRSEHASHHLVVSDATGAFRGILSSLDMARMLCCMSAPPEVLHNVRRTAVWAVMKRRATVPWCSQRETLGAALAKMASTHQNCVLVTAGDAGDELLGIITPRGALRSFVERMPLEVGLEHWLCGLRSRLEPRKFDSTLLVAGAAAAMAFHLVHHLLITSPDSEVVGVLSSSDLVRAIVSLEDIRLKEEALAPFGAA